MLLIPFRDTFLRKLSHFGDLSEPVDSRDTLGSGPRPSRSPVRSHSDSMPPVSRFWDSWLNPSNKLFRRQKWPPRLLPGHTSPACVPLPEVLVSDDVVILMTYAVISFLRSLAR